jgi:hypothetical protein
MSGSAVTVPRKSLFIVYLSVVVFNRFARFVLVVKHVNLSEFELFLYSYTREIVINRHKNIFVLFLYLRECLRKFVRD